MSWVDDIRAAKVRPVRGMLLVDPAGPGETPRRVSVHKVAPFVPYEGYVGDVPGGTLRVVAYEVEARTERRVAIFWSPVYGFGALAWVPDLEDRATFLLCIDAVGDDGLQFGSVYARSTSGRAPAELAGLLRNRARR